MKRKTTRRGRLKLLKEPGEFECVFCTLGVVDHDGDVITRGAIQDGQGVRISAWGHSWERLPVGKGEVFERANEGICQGSLFLNTSGGAETYEVIKGLGDLQEWSFSFDILDSEPRSGGGRTLRKLSIFEVSPVLLGAGISTRTTAIKSYYRGPTVPKDPKAVLRQMHYIAFEAGLGRPDVPADPVAVKRLIDDALFDAEISGLERLVKQGGDHPTNRDRLREVIARAWPDASDAYVETLVDIALRDAVTQTMSSNRFPDPETAWRMVLGWARRPA
jgi:hypothetical protein